MHPRTRTTPGWPIPLEDYDYTRLLTRPCWAWEFLRRDGNYRRDWLSSRPGRSDPILLRSNVKVVRLRKRFSRAEAWGLCSFRGPVSERA